MQSDRDARSDMIENNTVSGTERTSEASKIQTHSMNALTKKFWRRWNRALTEARRGHVVTAACCHMGDTYHRREWTTYLDFRIVATRRSATRGSGQAAE